jgi:hypothetical protein
VFYADPFFLPSTVDFVHLKAACSFLVVLPLGWAKGLRQAPEMLFYRIEQCQEIQMIAKDPYTPKQIISNAVRLLMALGIFPLKDFNMWEALPIKTYPILKTFVHEAYTRRLTSIQLRNTAGQQGYVQNPNNIMYNVFGEGDDKVTDNDTTITQTAMAATMGSTLGGAMNTATSKATIPSEVSAAINQLAANQTAMMNQMAAMQFSPPTPDATPAKDNSISHLSNS